VARSSASFCRAVSSNSLLQQREVMTDVLGHAFTTASKVGSSIGP
jgi:hypothetical protein